MIVTFAAARLAVDLSARTVEGTALPWDTFEPTHGLEFARGSLWWSDMSRVKLLLGHDINAPLGRAVALDDTGAGLFTRFFLGRSAAADEALRMAEDGVLDGLSVGVDIDEGGAELVAAGRMVVRRAQLREVSMTPMPLFDDARLATVAASRKDMKMTEPEATVPEPSAPAPAAEPMLTLSQWQELAATFAGPAGVQPPEPERPTVIDPTRQFGAGSSQPRTNPLAYTPEALDDLAASFASRTSVRVEGGARERFATVTTGLYGNPVAWGRNVLAGPRLLHVAAGVPTQSIDAIVAEFPSLTLPTATAGVAETVTVPEYASSATGTVTAARFGRWTDFSTEALIGTSPDAVVAMHQLGIALDLDKVLIDAVETAAGAPVAFNADVPGNVRRALARVQARTAAADVGNLVILVHPDDVWLLEDVQPIGGVTTGEGFSRFSGAMIYPSEAVNTGFITVANLSVGCRFFEARGVSTQTYDLAPKTGVSTVVTYTIAGYAVTLTSGFATTIDVVTP